MPATNVLYSPRWAGLLFRDAARDREGMGVAAQGRRAGRKSGRTTSGPRSRAASALGGRSSKGWASLSSQCQSRARSRTKVDPPPSTRREGARPGADTPHPLPGTDDAHPPIVPDAAACRPPCTCGASSGRPGSRARRRTRGASRSARSRRRGRPRRPGRRRSTGRDRATRDSRAVAAPAVHQDAEVEHQVVRRARRCSRAAGGLPVDPEPHEADVVDDLLARALDHDGPAHVPAIGRDREAGSARSCDRGSPGSRARWR